MKSSSRRSALRAEKGRSLSSVGRSLAPETLEQRLLFSHFRYAELHWNPGPQKNEIVFHMQESFRRDYFFGSAPDGYPAVGDTIDVGNPLDFGDGNSQNVLLKVTSSNPVTNIMYGYMVSSNGSEGISHVYATPGNYTAFATSCCRLSILQNDHDEDYQMQTIVNVGTGNSSPVSSLAPIIQVPDNQIDTFQVPAVDPNGDSLRFRFATGAEAGGVSTGTSYTLPPNISITPTGKITWDIRDSVTSTAPGDLWTAQVMVEDLDKSGNVKSKTPVDFIMQVTNGTINHPPVFDSIPTAIKPQAGKLLQFNVQASDPDAGNTVSVAPLNPPPGMTFTSTSVLPGSRANATAIKVSWTPTAAQAGQTYVVTFEAIDNNGATTDAAVTLSPTVNAPVANAGGPYVITVGSGVSLDGSKSTGTAPLTYSWDLNHDGVFGDVTGATPVLTAAQLATFGLVGGASSKVYTLTLKVTDGSGQSATATASLTIKPAAVALVANAGGPYTVDEGSSLTLNAAASTIPGGQTATYSWDINGDGVYGDATGVSPTLTWAQLSALGITDALAPRIYHVAVKVTAGGVTKISPATTLTVNNLPPAANAGPSQFVNVGDTVSLLGKFNLPDPSDSHTVSWKVTNAAKQVVATSTTTSLSLKPTVAGVYTATFSVTDDDGATATSTATITAAAVVSGPQVTQFILVDALTNKDLFPLTNGMTLDLGKLPRYLNVRAVTSGAVQSVMIGHDNVHHIEKNAPWSMFYDGNGDFLFGTFSDGAHTLSANAFSGKNGSGAAGPVFSIGINVISRPPALNFGVTAFQLVNTDTNQVIETFDPGYTVLTLSALPKHYALRAVIVGTVGSIVYMVDGAATASWAPALTPGLHVLTATGFSGAAGTGQAGLSANAYIVVNP